MKFNYFNTLHTKKLASTLLVILQEAHNAMVMKNIVQKEC